MEKGDIISYHLEVMVTDILIRNISVEVLAAIDTNAKRVGLSRNEYLRRRLEDECLSSAGPVCVKDLERLAVLTQDLADPAVMSSAWS